MERQLPAAQPTWSSDQILGVLGQATAITAALSDRRFHGSTLGDLLGRDPSLLRTWSNSKKRTPEATEQRCLAKILLALLEASDVVDVGALPAQPLAPAPRAAQKRPPVGFTEPNDVIRTKRRALLALAPPVKSGLRVAQARVLAVWAWAPRLCICLLLLCALFLVTHLELLAVIPMRLGSWVPVYCMWAIDRLLKRIDAEIAAMLGWPFPPSVATSTSASGIPTYEGTSGPLSRSGVSLGWLVAAGLYFKT